MEVCTQRDIELDHIVSGGDTILRVIVNGKFRERKVTIKFYYDNTVIVENITMQLNIYRDLLDVRGVCNLLAAFMDVHVFFVMEHCLCDFTRLLHHRRFSTSQSLTFAIQLLKGVEGMHEKGWIHRDIHPGNCLLRSDGTLVLSDFEMASQQGKFKVDNHPSRKKTPHNNYVAPECRIEFRNYSPKTDVFSVGAVVYFLLTRKPLFSMTSSPDKGISHVDNPSTSNLEARLKEEERVPLSHIILEMVDKDPEKRPTTTEVLTYTDLWKEAKIKNQDVDSLYAPIDLSLGPDQLSIISPTKKFETSMYQSRSLFKWDSKLKPIYHTALRDFNFLHPMFSRSEIDVTDPGSPQPGTSATAAIPTSQSGSNVAYFDPVSRKVKYYKGGRPANPRRIRDGTYHGNNDRRRTPDVKKSTLKRKTLVVDPNIKSIKFPVEITREIAAYKKSRPKIAEGTRKSRFLTAERRTTRVSKDGDNSVSDELTEVDIADLIQSSETEIRKLKKENVKKRPSESVQPQGVWKMGLHYPPSHKLGQINECAFELLIRKSSSSGGSFNVEQPTYVTKESVNEVAGEDDKVILYVDGLENKVNAEPFSDSSYDDNESSTGISLKRKRYFCCN